MLVLVVPAWNRIVVARYPIAVVKGSKNAPLANRFVDYLMSPNGQSILAEFGFTKP